jgi:NAD(P)-dependent dehydrogenase (short-subunit alcohol dehydrogenase family)
MTSRLAWVTGASSGLGRALVLRLAAEGWRVVVSARREEELRDLAGEAAGEIHVYPLDVTDRAACAETIAAIVRDCGPIDLAVLNAGTYEPDGIGDFSAEQLARTVGLNLLGAGNCLAPLLTHYRERGKGHVALVASLSGYRGLPRAASYGASKAGLINLAESLRTQAAGFNIKVQVINPGFVKTPLTDRNEHPMPFLMEVDDAAAALYRGLMHGGFEITFPRRFAAFLKLARVLPYGSYFPLVSRVTGL